jgi:hypothetical protein
MCNQGVCSGAVDAGATLPNGSPCTATSPCAGTCLDEVIFGQTSGYVGGYCTETCGAAPCSNGVCVTEVVFGQTFAQCRATCPAPGTQSTCRPSYVCAPIAGSATGYCRPNCSNTGILAACQPGTTCMSNGVCL